MRYFLGLRLAPPTSSAEKHLDTISVQEWGYLLSNGQHPSLRLAGALTLSTPVHLEVGSDFVGHVDAEPSIVVPTSDNYNGDGPRVLAAVAPGGGVWLGSRTAVGLRFPTHIVLASEFGQDASFSVEPYTRLLLGMHGFVGMRLNLQLADDLFESDFWALMLGGGGVF